MSYPSIFSSLATPQASDRLNNPSHSQLHQNENSGILEIQRFVGTDSSAVGTLVNDIRSPSSNGGGHVQTAIKGGTGQTTYIKGDLLVAQSASVLAKLATGLDGQILTANSSAASGVNWGNVTSPKIFVSVMGSILQTNTSETSLVSLQIPGSTLGISNAVKLRVFIDNQFKDINGTLTIKALYGTASLMTFNIGSVQANQNNDTFSGYIDYTLMAGGAVNQQMAVLSTSLSVSNVRRPANSILAYNTFATFSGTSSVNSNAPLNIGITGQWNLSDNSNGITTRAAILERIT